MRLHAFGVLTSDSGELGGDMHDRWGISGNGGELGGDRAVLERFKSGASLAGGDFNKDRPKV